MLGYRIRLLLSRGKESREGLGIGRTDESTSLDVFLADILIKKLKIRWSILCMSFER